MLNADSILTMKLYFWQIIISMKLKDLWNIQCSLINIFLLLLLQCWCLYLHVSHQLGEVLERSIVVVVVGEGGVVTVDVEGDREHLRHDAVVSDQRCQTAVHLQEPLTQVQSFVFYETVEKQPKMSPWSDIHCQLWWWCSEWCPGDGKSWELWRREPGCQAESLTCEPWMIRVVQWPGHSSPGLCNKIKLEFNAFNDLTLGYSTSDSVSSPKFDHLALLVALVSFSSNFHHWSLLALLVALVSQSSNFHHWPLLA